MKKFVSTLHRDTPCSQWKLNNRVFYKCIRWIQLQILIIKRTIQTFNLLCKRPRCYYRSNKTPITERSLNWLQFMFQSLIRFTDFPFCSGKTPSFPYHLSQNCVSRLRCSALRLLTEITRKRSSRIGKLYVPKFQWLPPDVTPRGPQRKKFQQASSDHHQMWLPRGKRWGWGPLRCNVWGPGAR